MLYSIQGQHFLLHNCQEAPTQQWVSDAHIAAVYPQCIPVVKARLVA